MLCVQSNHALHFICCLVFWEMAMKPVRVFGGFGYLEGVVGAEPLWRGKQ